ncbi:MAG: histidinol dehydrogenase [Planctomycetota bacterium]
MTRLQTISASDFTPDRTSGIDSATLSAAGDIVSSVRTGGEQALRRYAEQFGERVAGEALLLGPDVMQAALDGLDMNSRAVLERAHTRIRDFAAAQKRSLKALDVEIEGGRAGHTIEPMERAGCYVPGGRYPLPSTALMTVTSAREAGCATVVAASPCPGPEVLAACAVAGADGVLAVGGAHAIAALAYGVGLEAPMDIIVGPGNRWVTAAKRLVSGDVAIDMLAGPSELLVLADGTADPALIAADLLAQAEHDTDARPYLVTDTPELIEQVNAALEKQLAELDTAATAEVALRNGAAILTSDLEQSIAVTDRCAPEHLEVHTRDAREVASRIRHAGAVFVGSASAEVFGDYGAGPNHTLPTGGTARTTGGLSVLTFLRVRTWLEVDAAASRTLAGDVAALADMEGLAGHASSCRVRSG